MFLELPVPLPLSAAAHGSGARSCAAVFNHNASRCPINTAACFALSAWVFLIACQIGNVWLALNNLCCVYGKTRPEKLEHLQENL